MPERVRKSGGLVGLILLVVVVVLAIRACRSEACCDETGAESATAAA